MDRGSWWATVHGVAKSRTQLNNWHFLSCGILALQPGIKPTLPELEGKVSTTGTIGKSPTLICFDVHFHLWICLTRAPPFYSLHFIYLAPFCFFLSSLFFYHYYYFLFVYVLVVSCGVKFTRDGAWAPCIGWAPALGGLSLNHWTAREIPLFCF